MSLDVIPWFLFWEWKQIAKSSIDHMQVLGHVSYHLLVAGCNGYMATVTNLKDHISNWRCGGAPLTVSSMLLLLCLGLSKLNKKLRITNNYFLLWNGFVVESNEFSDVSHPNIDLISFVFWRTNPMLQMMPLLSLKFLAALTRPINLLTLLV